MNPNRIGRFPSVLAGALAIAAFHAVSSLAHATPVLVVDAETRRVLYEEEAGAPWYPASTTKLMSAYVVFEALARGEVTLDTPVVISKEAMGEASLHAGLKAGRSMRLEDALYAMVVGSANEVSVSLAETVAGSVDAFAGRMNDVARRLGMTASHFSNPNGLFAKDHVTTARDLALLGVAAATDFPQYRPLFETFQVIIDGKTLESENTLLTGFPGTIGFKTGFLCASGRNVVAMAERGGRRILVVILGATTGRERSERAAKLMTEAFDGTLAPSGRDLAALQNNPSLPPEDMRMRVCSDETAAYEAKRNRLYPMGLPGEVSYLGADIAPRAYAFQTTEAAPTFDVPIPTLRPVRPYTGDRMP
ncbi:D-alanyl-D-alanine carboxypeptidase family protein [Fulvimarina sp. 2208YS6-2-32]|uniref:D-alanyl-D-alanine carboxypeptidase family protein n=1 Tax=Fulvimarina uroteuthidis TaxID=3098149 RepID=A0ABU5I8F9_9HYPH|nr:D-alanyl-D-alanine carboxypeptidase family protein [Fulvimarina sp. 2208YS6-2-32]MDY8111098.1 D-alanyl-D-alanine carboxypeptidase family protein [Fulvimarina sp. 2208YS6-2-32]